MPNTRITYAVSYRRDGSNYPIAVSDSQQDVRSRVLTNLMETGLPLTCYRMGCREDLLLQVDGKEGLASGGMDMNIEDFMADFEPYRQYLLQRLTSTLKAVSASQSKPQI